MNVKKEVTPGFAGTGILEVDGTVSLVPPQFGRIVANKKKAGLARLESI